MQTTTNPPIHEYIYVDQQRLDSYFHQISPDSTYDKIPEWKVGLSLTGPKVSASQRLQRRRLASHEKVTKVLNYLQSKNYICGSPEYQNIKRKSVKGGTTYIPFVFQKITAIRMIIPLKYGPIGFQERGEDSKLRALWIHSNIDETLEDALNGKTLSICLMEDFQNDDNKVNFPLFSFYSSLVGMILDCYKAIRQTVLIDNDDFASLESADTPHILNLMFKYMRCQPIRVLVQAGAKITGPPRFIETLYRIRDYFESRSMGIHLFGYPIFIRETI